MRKLKEFFRLIGTRHGEALQPPLENIVLPDQQRDKLERDILILEDEFGAKEKKSHKEAERQVQDAAEDSLKQLHVIQMGRCPHCGEHLNEHLFASICEACGWSAFEVPRKGPARIHLLNSDFVIEGERCYVTAAGDVFVMKNDVVIAKVNKASVSWIEYNWTKEEMDQRYKQALDRLKVACNWCNGDANPEKPGFSLVQVAFGSSQERYVFCSENCYEAFRRMYPSRVHRNCYDRDCAECTLCTKRYDDETDSMRMIAKDFLKVKKLTK